MSTWPEVQIAWSPDGQKDSWPESQISWWIYGLYKVYKTNSKYWCSLSDPSKDIIFHPNYCLKFLYWIRNCFEHFPISTNWNVVFVTTHLFFLSLNAVQKKWIFKSHHCCCCCWSIIFWLAIIEWSLYNRGVGWNIGSKLSAPSTSREVHCTNAIQPSFTLWGLIQNCSGIIPPRLLAKLNWLLIFATQ